MIEEALVQRIIETLGACATAIMPVHSDREVQRRAQLGFSLDALEPSTERTGYVANDLSIDQPRIVVDDDEGTRFAIESDEPIPAGEN